MDYLGAGHNRGTVPFPHRTRGIGTAYGGDVNFDDLDRWCLVTISPVLHHTARTRSSMHVHSCTLATAWVEGQGQLGVGGSRFPPFTTWVPGIEFTAAGLALNTITH